MANIDRKDIIHKIDRWAVIARVMAVDCEHISNTSDGFTDIELMEATNDAYKKFQNTIHNVICDVEITEEEFETLSPNRRHAIRRGRR